MNRQEILKSIAIEDVKLSENPRDYKAVSRRELLLGELREFDYAPSRTEEERINTRMAIEARWG